MYYIGATGLSSVGPGTSTLAFQEAIALLSGSGAISGYGVVPKSSTGCVRDGLGLLSAYSVRFAIAALLPAPRSPRGSRGFSDAPPPPRERIRPTPSLE